MVTAIDRFINSSCKILSKNQQDQFAQVHFGFITAIDWKSMTLFLTTHQRTHHINLSDIIAIREIS